MFADTLPLIVVAAALNSCGYVYSWDRVVRGTRGIEWCAGREGSRGAGNVKDRVVRGSWSIMQLTTGDEPGRTY